MGSISPRNSASCFDAPNRDRANALPSKANVPSAASAHRAMRSLSAHWTFTPCPSICVRLSTSMPIPEDTPMLTEIRSATGADSEPGDLLHAASVITTPAAAPRKSCLTTESILFMNVAKIGTCSVISNFFQRTPGFSSRTPHFRGWREGLRRQKNLLRGAGFSAVVRQADYWLPCGACLTYLSSQPKNSRFQTMEFWGLKTWCASSWNSTSRAGMPRTRAAVKASSDCV